MENGESNANACSDDDNDDGVDVQKIVQHCHFKSKFHVYDDDNYDHGDNFDSDDNEAGRQRSKLS